MSMPRLWMSDGSSLRNSRMSTMILDGFLSSAPPPPWREEPLEDARMASLALVGSRDRSWLVPSLPSRSSGTTMVLFSRIRCSKASFSFRRVVR